jgi:hypothetical protein
MVTSSRTIAFLDLLLFLLCGGEREESRRRRLLEIIFDVEFNVVVFCLTIKSFSFVNEDKDTLLGRIGVDVPVVAKYR